MKGLCVRQPWAHFIAIGRKTVEVRSWSTNYRGPLVIVAARTVDQAPEFADMIPDDGLHTGCLYCVVNLSDVRRGKASDSEAAMCSAEGQFAWVLEPVRMVEGFPSYRGRLSLFEVPEVTLEPATVKRVPIGRIKIANAQPAACAHLAPADCPLARK